MTRARQTVACLASAKRETSNFWQDADRLGSMCFGRDIVTAKVQMVDRLTHRMNPIRWPLCPLCGLSSVEHGCDPDDTVRALMEQPQ